MLKFLKNNELILGVAGAILFLAVVGLVFYSINFLARNAANVAGLNLPKQEPITRFNLGGLKELGIIRQN